MNFLTSLNGWQIAGLIWAAFVVVTYTLMAYDIYKYRHINRYED